MSLCKAVIMGEVVRKPEKRFTSKDLAITSFAINISESDEESLIRVIAMGKLAETAASILNKGTKVVVEGKLQTNVVKTSSGEEKKIVEISAQALEVVSGGSSSVATVDEEAEEMLFEDTNVSDDLIGEDEIPF